MFLKALTIKGFKSFAEPARLELEPGITVVVGPNGSGKSNVVDAIAWVLGAQAPTAVRSQKMDDVIFAGTTSRPALGRAEVTLTIDNNDRALPIEFTEVNITRTLFRSGDSEYSINNVPCRLLDIQELLSDTGVGRQQHIIVSQGQIDAVLNARPEERRLIIEEAAGVLKYRKRKERSERRLAATDENLNRLADLVREVRRQLRPLEKQADAALRYSTLIEELTGLRWFLAGRELAALRARLEQSHRQRADLSARDAELTRQLAGLDANVTDAEAELAALGGSDVGDVLSRARSLRERLLGQTKVVGERRRRLEQELRATIDEGVVASLESEAARITTELLEARQQDAALDPEAVELADAENLLSADLRAFEEEWGAGIGPAPTAAAEVRAQLSALSSAAERDTKEEQRVRDQLGPMDQRGDAWKAERQTAVELAGAARSELPRLEAQLSELEAQRLKAEEHEAEAEEQRRLCDGEANRWQARADALEQALDEVRSAAGVDALSGLDGVLGTLLDLVAIDDGWESAVEAAAGEALRAVVVAGVDEARSALRSLQDQDVSGAVLALGPSYPAPPVSTGGVPVRDHVRALRSDVEPLLDALVGSAVLVDGGWSEALDLALRYPEAVILTSAGDRFSATGWSLGSGASGATGAALEEARLEEAASVQRAENAAAALAAAREERARIDQERREAEKVLGRTRSELAEAERTAERLAARLEEQATDRARLEAQLTEIRERSALDREQLGTLQRQLPSLEAAETEHRARAQSMAEARSSIEERSRLLSRMRNDLDVRQAAVSQRIEGLAARQTEIESRLVRLADERQQARVKREHLQEALLTVEGLASQLVSEGDCLDGWLSLLSAEQDAQSEAARRVSARLTSLRNDRSDAERELTEIRERQNKLELNEAENKVRLETLTEAIRRDFETEPASVLGSECPPLPEGTSPEARVRELEREVKHLGPINPLALEEFEELKTRHEFLQGQVDDVKSTKRDLQRLIREIDDQIVNVFSAAYVDVSENFTSLFATLFPGGTGAVRLTNADDLLHCGVEIEAKPSGKNVKKLSLLSGGERSLTALGFLFAVFRSRPSPFYVMDEVEAALDDMNLNRFLALMQEFRREAQLVVVSHQKRTMEAADVLYGVSMKPGGSSKVVSEKVDIEKMQQLAESGSDPAS